MRASCAALLMAPTSVFLSSGSPTRSRSIRAHSLRVTSSATLSCSSSREPAQQTWPWLKKIPSMMPSTAWSSAASSNTMLADLPPSSSVSPVPVPASARWISLPTAVEPVKAILSSAGADELGARAPVAGDDVDDAGGEVGLLADLGQQQRGQRRRLGRLQDRGVAGGERRRELPRRHQQREVPRHDLADDAARLVRAAAERVLQLVRPARVGEEVLRRRAGRRRRATRGSACRRRATRRPPARAPAPGSAARCGTGTCRARAAAAPASRARRRARPRRRGRRPSAPRTRPRRAAPRWPG